MATVRTIWLCDMSGPWTRVYIGEKPTRTRFDCWPENRSYFTLFGNVRRKLGLPPPRKDHEAVGVDIVMTEKREDG